MLKFTIKIANRGEAVEATATQSYEHGEWTVAVKASHRVGGIPCLPSLRYDPEDGSTLSTLIDAANGALAAAAKEARHH